MKVDLRVRGVYDTGKQHFYWQAQANDLHISCSQILLMRVKWISSGVQVKDPASPGNGTLVFVTIDILGPLLRNTTQNLQIIIEAHRFSRFKRAISTATVNLTQLAIVFFNN